MKTPSMSLSKSSGSIFLNRYSTGLRRRELFAGLAFAAIPLIGFAAFYFIPFGITITRTFTAGLGSNAFVGFHNYESVMYSEAFRLAAFNTFRFIGIGVPLLMALALVIALMLNARLKGKDVFRAAYVVPLIIPTASVILVFQIFFETGGVVNYFRDLLGLGTINFLQSGNIFWILILLYLWKNIGFAIIITLTGLTQIPVDYYDAARVDGAGGFAVLWKITLPLMAPTFFFLMVISIVGSFKSFREAFVLGGNYPHESIYLLQHFMNNNFARINYTRLSVAAVLTFLVIFAFVLFMYLRRGRESVL